MKKRHDRRSQVDGKFIGNLPLDRIREGLKISFRDTAEADRRRRLGVTDAWDRNPARKVS